MLIIHPSSAWLGLTCPESLREVSGSTDEHSIYAAFGRAGHSVMRHVGERGLSELPDLSEWIERFNIEDVEGFEAACRFAMKRWLQLREFFPAPEFEMPVQAEFAGKELWKIAGTEDVSSISGNRADILDWKMGHKEHVGRWQVQMKLYLAADFQMIRLEYPEAEPLEGSATVVFFGDGSHTTWQWSEQDVMDFVAEFTRDAVNRLGKFVPGPHCEWCARGRVPPQTPLHCAKGREAWGTFIEAVVSGLPAIQGETVPARAELVRVFEMAKAVERGSKSFLAKVRTYLEAQPGQRIELGDGRFLGFKQVVKREVKPIEGIAVFERWLEDEDLAVAVKLSKSTAIAKAKEVLEARESDLPRGWKAALERDINGALESAGAFVEREESHMGIYEKESGDGQGKEAGQIAAAGE